MSRNDSYLLNSPHCRAKRDAAVTNENLDSTTSCLGKITTLLLRDPLTLSLSGRVRVALQSFNWFHSPAALDRQQSSGAMVIIGYTDIDERTRKLDTEQTLAGSKRSREYVIFKGDFFT